MRKSSVFIMMQAAAWCAETTDLRCKVMTAGHNLAVQHRELLQMVMQLLIKSTPEARNALSIVSRKIAHCVTELVATTEPLKGKTVIFYMMLPGWLGYFVG